MTWCLTARREFPPEGVLVWTHDGCVVTKGRWTFGGTGVPLEEGSWSDERGNPIAVVGWMFLEESPRPPFLF